MVLSSVQVLLLPERQAGLSHGEGRTVDLGEEARHQPRRRLRAQPARQRCVAHQVHLRKRADGWVVIGGGLARGKSWLRSLRDG
jgi:hypothetical protein